MRSPSTDGSLLSPGHAPSPSSDKTRALKMFKTSSDSQSGKEHQRTTSVMSESTKRTLIAFQDQEAEVRFCDIGGRRRMESTDSIFFV